MVVYDKIEAGKRLTEVINDSGLKSRGFAQKLKIDPSYLSKMESGKTGISKTNLDAIAEEFDINSHWLLFGTGTKKMDKTVHVEQIHFSAHNSENQPPPDPMIIISQMVRANDKHADANKENSAANKKHADSINRLVILLEKKLNSTGTGSTSQSSKAGKKQRSGHEEHKALFSGKGENGSGKSPRKQKGILKN